MQNSALNRVTPLQKAKGEKAIVNGNWGRNILTSVLKMQVISHCSGQSVWRAQAAAFTQAF